MKKLLILLPLLFCLSESPVDASTAAQSDIGYLSTSCGSAPPPCFIQYGATIPVSGTFTVSGTQDTNLKQVNGATVNVGSGAAGPGTQRIILSTDSPLPSGASTAALQSNVQAAPTASTPATVNFVEPVDVTGAQPNFATPVPVVMSDPYPSGAIAVSCSTGNVAAATATCTMPATSAKTTYITHFDITGSGATLGAAVTCTLTNTGSGTHSYTFIAIAGALLADQALSVSFNPALKASAQNTSPVLSCPSLGTGNTNTTINADGYQL